MFAEALPCKPGSCHFLGGISKYCKIVSGILL